jgi:putative ABC transport system permease protein
MALKRSKEVGIRKVNGATRRKLLIQFLLESFFYSFAALLLALILCAFAMPLFNSISNQNYSLSELFSLNNSIATILIVVVVALLSGLYPAIFISGFRIIDSIKINQIPTSSLSYSRKLLIVIQFSISLFMIISTLVISQQLKYVQQKDLGFNRENIMILYTYGDLSEVIQNNRQYVYNELNKNPDIKKVGATSNMIGTISSVEYLQPDGKDMDFSNKVMRFFRSDEGFIPSIGIEIIKGRNFIPELDSGGAFIVNEKVVEMLDLENPIGTMATNTSMGTRGPIVGVMKDFNFASLHNKIEPLILSYKPIWANTLILKISGTNINETIGYIENFVKKTAPGTLFAYDFLDNKLNQMYMGENRMNLIFSVFAIFSIIISCTGLYGLAAYSAELRTKEIGIRKAFGASNMKIFKILSSVYLRLIFISFIIAIPTSNYFITEWLKNFEFHIAMAWTTFIIAGATVIFIAFLAVFGRSLKAARNNPAISLRTE